MNSFLLVIGILIICIPVPLMIIFHYTTQWKKLRELSAADEKLIKDLWDHAQRMEDRVHTLETILDEKDTTWRNNG
ncbi:MAG: envelope stress response membrane protein PspB [Pseudomonadota bacterium]